MKRPGERVKLTFVGFCYPPLESGDIIQTTTGRRYEIIEAGETICRDDHDPYQRLDCRVMRPTDRIAGDARILHWMWLPRKRTKK